MSITNIFGIPFRITCCGEAATQFYNPLQESTSSDLRATIGGGDPAIVARNFLKKTNKLSDFPWNAVREAKKKFSNMYAKLRDDFKKGRKKYDCCKISEDAKEGKSDLERRLKMYGRPSCVREMEESEYLENPWLIWVDPEVPENSQLPRLYDQYKMSSVLDVLITEDFLKGIFGEKFWNILEYDISECAGSGFHVSFDISEISNAVGLEDLFKCCRSYHGNMKQDAVSFERTSGYDVTHRDINWEWFDSNYIEFVFFYDPLEDKISHVKLRNKLILNDELIAEGIERDVLLPVDGQDYDEPGSFEALMELHGIIKKNGTRP